MRIQAKKLVHLLLDHTARIDERDDAAIDLGSFDEKEVLQALIHVASDFTEDEILLASCGESIGEIWQRNKILDKVVVDALTPVARRELLAFLKLD